MGNGILGLRGGALSVAILLGLQSGWTQTENRESYLEFGKVVTLNQQGVEVQTTDPAQGRPVRRSFTFTRDTLSDVVRPGDTVEVIYSAGSRLGEDWVLERLVALHGAVPKIGPAPAVIRATVAAASPAVAPSPASLAASSSRGKSVSKRMVVAERAAEAARKAEAGKPVANATPDRIAKTKGTGAEAQPVALGVTSKPRVPDVIPVSLGGVAERVNAPALKVKTVAQETVGEQCNRTSDWASQPISIAVLDFRYPTEREESHDKGSIGGGSGTAVADLVYSRLEGDPNIALRRGDREKLFRMDFAGAARLGRQLGVDAVLLGTFAPVEVPNADPDFPPVTEAYTLRAGVVETCTGELLYHLTSETCPALASGAPAPGCPGGQGPAGMIPVKAAADPEKHVGVFQVPIATLVTPVMRDGTPAGVMGTAGVVTAAGEGTVTFRLGDGVSLRVGDQVRVDAMRLAKNPTTNTLHVYKHEEIGRVRIARVSGGVATGTFQGDIPPKVGDTVDLVTE